MLAQSLRLHNLRNHLETLVTGLSPRINVLAGPNGAGKTSILEALSLATLTKSFTTHTDAILLRNGSSDLDVEAQFETDLGVPHRVVVQIVEGPPIRKSIFANSDRLRSAADLIGRAPVVVLTPDHKVITGGPPAERRRFLDLVLSQASHSYLEDEIEFRRALKQRNAILADARKERRSMSVIAAMLEPWTELVMKHGARVMQRRAKFTAEFRPHLLDAYRMISEMKETPSLHYQPMGIDSDVSDFPGLLQSEYERLQIEEVRRGTSLIGPHRDELLLYINPGQEAKHYASQGQHKTLLVAMKLAEFEYLREASSETPILLLDDVFSELDRERAHQLLELAESGKLGQTFITSTNRETFDQKLDFRNGTHQLFLASNGAIVAAN